MNSGVGLNLFIILENFRFEILLNKFKGRLCSNKLVFIFNFSQSWFYSQCLTKRCTAEYSLTWMVIKPKEEFFTKKIRWEFWRCRPLAKILRTTKFFENLTPNLFHHSNSTMRYTIRVEIYSICVKIINILTFYDF